MLGGVPRRLIPLVLVAAACGGSPAAPPTPAVAEPRPDVLMSDPAEYAIDRVSRDAGEEIFVRTGIGDPYRTGIPYPVFLALLRAYPDVFGATPGELAARFGFVPRAADPASEDLDVREGLPVGMHLTVDPITEVPFLVTSCALCHAEQLRWPGGEALVIGLGNKRVRIHAYDAAFAEVARRDDFATARLWELADAAAEERGLAWTSEYRGALVKATVAALRDRAEVRAELLAHTAASPPGRVASIEAFAIALEQELGQDVALPAEVGWAKIPDVIGFAARVTLSWDAIGEGPMDVLVVEADFAAGVRPEWFWAHPLQGASLGAYLRQPPPRPAFPGAIDRALAARGRESFDDNCGPCHGAYGDDGRVVDYDEQVVPLADVGTDPARAMAATDSFVAAANDPELTRGITRVRPTGGYVPPVLTSVWARAPYGHAGQWPSLAVVATPPARRAARYVLDLDAAYDLDAVGVAARPADGAEPGLSTAGHPFLSDLGDDAVAVIEYLKTL
jgi:mono/diheme cytochrome c family protein